MAGISEIYSAQAMLDSHMINTAREGMAGLDTQQNPETEYKLRRVTEKFLESLHIMLNEPSVGLFRIQEHVRRSVPQLVDKKNEMQSYQQKVEGLCYDLDYSIKTVKSLHHIPHFTIIQECLKSAMASKQNLDKAKLESKYKKADQEQTPGSDSVSDVLDVIGEEEAIEVQGFICPNCMQLWNSQDELLEHWTSAHNFSDDATDNIVNPGTVLPSDEDSEKTNKQAQYQETGEQEEFAHVTAADSLPKEGSEIPREQDQDYPSAL